jgi:uncharacterized membrane protein
MRHNRPRIKIEWDRLDYMMEIAGWFVLAAALFITVYFYPKLPDIIPSHFNAAGEADGWSGKGTIWISPAIAIILFMGIRILTNYPHQLNYITPITEENAEYQYRLAARLLRSLNLIIAGMFFFIQWSIVRGALGKGEGSGAWFLPVFISLMVFIVVFYLVKSSGKNR